MAHVKYFTKKMVPLAEVLAAIPGKSAAHRAKLCGVSRAAYYYWLNGVHRPNPNQARRLAELTGYSFAEITGRVE